MQTIKQLQENIEVLKSQIQDKEKEIDSFDISEFATHSDYDDWLDDAYGYVSVAGMDYTTSDILKLVDPVAYRCGFSDYCDGLSPDDFTEYREMQEELEELESELFNAECDLEEFEQENDKL